jgi:hypothetical protein
LLPIVAIDEAVFRLSVFGEGSGGETTDSLFDVVFLESQENGLVNFLEGGAGVGIFAVGGGGGGGKKRSTDGSAPDKP